MPELETTCRWCGASLRAHEASGRGSDAQRLDGRTRCAACGVAVTDPWPTPEELDAAYADWYRPESGRFSGPGDLVLRRARATLARRIDSEAPAGAVLDIGSGDGTLVRAVEQTGRRAEGVERGDRDLADCTGPYAAVVLWHALEHLPDPAGALRHAARVLLPGGLLVVAVPNAGSLQARAFGDRWFGLDIPRHLFHFTPTAVARFCEDLGLQVRGVSHFRGGQVVFGWLHGLVGFTGVDLYDAIRRPEARRAPLAPAARALALALAVVLLPVAAILAVVEAAARQAGTFVLEAERNV